MQFWRWTPWRPEVCRGLGVTIQLSDAGIHPGSGVGNHRNSLTRETLGVPVIAIGVPTVVGAAAIVHDTVGALVAALKEGGEAGYGDMVEHMDGRDPVPADPGGAGAPDRPHVRDAPQHR